MKNKYGYAETRTIAPEAIRSACIAHDWYYCGTEEEFEELLAYGFSGRPIGTDELVEMATLIKEHSDTEDDYCYILYELARLCRSTFKEV